MLDRSGREDVRLHQPRCSNASAFGLRLEFRRVLFRSPCAVPPSTDFHLGHIVAVLRRSPAPVASSRWSPRRRADGTLHRHFAGLESGDHHRAERVLELGGAVVSVLDRWIEKTYDYFLYVVSSLPQSVCVGYVDNTLPSLLCIT